MPSVRDQKGDWIFLAPINRLKITETFNYEYRVDRVTFIATSRLPRRRRGFGFPDTLSNLKLNKFVSETQTIGIVRLSGKGETVEQKCLHSVREELSILCLSSLGFLERRGRTPLPTVASEHSVAHTEYCLFNTRTRGRLETTRSLNLPLELILDERWKIYERGGFFKKLISILQKRAGTRIKSAWREAIRRAAVLGGDSQRTHDLSQAFLLNMIALEILLIGNERFLSAFPERVESFLGWVSEWRVKNYEKRIQDVYRRRCEFVHSGFKRMDHEDVLFTDYLLLNTLTNIVGHPRLFSSKQSIIDFSEKVKAEKLLGAKPKVQPGTLRHLISDKYRDILK